MTNTVWDALAQQVSRAGDGLSGELHGILAGHADLSIRAAWLQRDDCPQALLDARAGRERDEELLHAIATHPNLGPRGRRILSGHAVSAVAVTTALRADLDDEEGVAILTARGRSVVRAALDRRKHRRWTVQRIVPDSVDDRWWDGLARRPRTAAKAAELVPLQGIGPLLAAAPHPEVWQVFDRRLSGIDFDDTDAVGRLLALHLAHDRPLTPALRRAALRNGGLVGAYASLLRAFEQQLTGVELADRYTGTALDTDLGTQLLRHLRRDRSFSLLAATNSARLAEALQPLGDTQAFTEVEWLQLITAGGKITKIVEAAAGAPHPWSRRSVEHLVDFVAHTAHARDPFNRSVDKALVGLCSEHLDVVVDRLAPQMRLARAVASHPACTVELAMRLPVGAAFASYHDPVALAQAVLEASGEALDVLSTLSTQFQGSVADLVSVAVGIDRETP